MHVILNLPNPCANCTFMISNAGWMRSLSRVYLNELVMPIILTRNMLRSNKFPPLNMLENQDLAPSCAAESPLNHLRMKCFPLDKKKLQVCEQAIIQCHKHRDQWCYQNINIFGEISRKYHFFQPLIFIPPSPNTVQNFGYFAKSSIFTEMPPCFCAFV